MTSYRRATEFLNRIFGRTEATLIKLRTLSDGICRIGNEISNELNDVTAKILTLYGFDAESGLPVEGATLPDYMTSVHDGASFRDGDDDKIAEAIAAVNDSREEKIPFSPEEIKIEPPSSHCVYISIDDVCVKHQKDSREEGSVRDYKFVKNTVAHIQIGNRQVVLTGIGMLNVFRSVLAFLLITGQICRQLVFLTDGANDIKGYINSIFSFHPYIVVLDWFHLKKRCHENLSMSIKKDKHNTVLTKLLRYLWVGDVVSAISYLSYLETSDIKSKKCLDDFINYLDRKKYAIACYALRDKLGLRNSSNSVEKANDLIVSKRQKKDGMAWSPNGSGALASLNMIYMNEQLGIWLTEKRIVPFDRYYDAQEAA